jgi:exopolyphosphatase/pppGpp-phosphohydrolase
VRERVRLSECLGAAHVLRPGPMDRAVHLIKIFKSLRDANGIDTLNATATSAVHAIKRSFYNASSKKRACTCACCRIISI